MSSQFGQEQQPVNRALPLRGPTVLASLGGRMSMNGPGLVGVPAPRNLTAPGGNGSQVFSTDAEDFAMRYDGMSLTQEPYGDGQGVPLTPTSDSPLSLDIQEGTTSSIVSFPILPTAGAATQAAGGTHIHGHPAQLAVVQPASTQPPSNALLSNASRIPSSAAALAAQTNIPIEVAQQLMNAAMSRRQLLSENQQLMDALARVCPECSTAVTILLLEVFDGERRTVIERGEQQAMAQQIVELRTVLNELKAEVAEIRQQDGRGDDFELSEDET
ncbi:hypothetical protein EWM64_g7110 [Hericium alpestre]|uniref:Uncharacterized protein n=1 Tax=Hericium alpestre TaxID=135208 RepID=A0A4Y9ZTS1_9AGAM|nr:hypothetical protein EWM64_g7110 [Hericium alpestre]